MTIIIVICLYTLKAYIANNMKQDQTAALGQSGECFHDQKSLECI